MGVPFLLRPGDKEPPEMKRFDGLLDSYMEWYEARGLSEEYVLAMRKTGSSEKSISMVF